MQDSKKQNVGTYFAKSMLTASLLSTLVITGCATQRAETRPIVRNLDSFSLPAQARTDRYARVVYCGGAGPWACSRPTEKTSIRSDSANLIAANLVAMTDPVADPIPAPEEAPVVQAPERVEESVASVPQEKVDPIKDVVFRNILFGFASSAISKDGKEVLDAYWMSLKNRKIELVGYTDNIGERDRNEEIAQSRALAVKQYLMSKGLYDSQIRIRGRGLCCYIANNKSDETRGLNRRVEIHLMGD